MGTKKKRRSNGGTEHEGTKKRLNAETPKSRNIDVPGWGNGFSLGPQRPLPDPPAADGSDHDKGQLRNRAQTDESPVASSRAQRLAALLFQQWQADGTMPGEVAHGH